MSNWIDFRALRANLSFDEVLRHYGVEVKRRGAQHHGFCPLPSHNGKRNSPSFSANLERGIFQCFGCKAKGNLLDFACLMEKEDPKDGAALHKIAATLRERFLPGTDSQPKKPPHHVAEQFEFKAKNAVVVNAPLDFELKGLDGRHPYLLSRGFSPQTIRHFGLGYCSRGMLKGRIAIPLHDE